MSQHLETKKNFAIMCGVSACAVTKQLKGVLKPALVGDRIDISHPAALEYRKRKTAPVLPEPVPGVDPLFSEALKNCQQQDRWTASHVARSLSIGWHRAVRIHSQLAAAGHIPAQDDTPVGSSGQSPAPKPPSPKKKRNQEDLPNLDDEIIPCPDDLGSLAEMSLRELINKFGTGTRFYDWLKALKELEAVDEKRLKNAQTRGKLVSRRLVETGVIDPFNSANVRLMTDGARTITAAVIGKHKAGVSEAEIEAYVSDVVGSFIKPVKDKVRRNLESVPEE